MKEAIGTESAPAAIGPYSQGMAAGELVFTAGQIGLDPGTGEFAGEDVATQTRQVMRNLAAVLEAAGLGLGDVVKTTIFLADMGDFETVNEIYGEHLSEPYPARSTVEAGRLPRGARVEIEAVARRPAGGG
jgi:2-iminobutanoate/2-iminopropanoate deaminase